MLTPGSMHRLHLTRFTDNGAYLIDKDMCEVLLPNRYVTEKMAEGDTVEVFIYHDSEDRLVACTDLPTAMCGEIGVFEVVSAAPMGVFLDWGLPKDMFMPKANYSGALYTGDKVVAGIYIDQKSGRLVATAKLSMFVSNREIFVEQGQEVDLIIAQNTETGYRAVVNKKNWGALYFNQIFEDIEIGMKMKGYVKEITVDNRIDIMLRRDGYSGVLDLSEKLVAMMQQSAGTLSLTDSSSPEEIYEKTQMSKKVFKRAVGSLLKSGTIEKHDGFLALTAMGSKKNNKTEE